MRTDGGVLPGKKAFIVLSIVLVSLLLGRTLYRDLTLSEEFLEGVQPDMTIELNDVNFHRGRSDDLWLFAVDSINRVNGKDFLKGIKGVREGLDGNSWHLRSPSGEFQESGDILILSEGNGRFVNREEAFIWSAPDILWGGQSSDVWAFPSGIIVSGDSYNMNGKKGEASPSGKLYLEEGVMEWQNR